MSPPPDRGLSPYTGWTRAHWTDLADSMLAAVDRHRSPLGARYDLPGPASRNGRISDGLEGFARTFLLAGFRIAGDRGADPTGLLDRYAEGLRAGTDPASPEYWPRPDELGQAKVEAASIALILQLTRPWLWDRLDDAVRERTLDWLAGVIGQPYPPINWVWFRIIVESFLREAGGPWSAEDVEQDLAVHAALRRPGGWLSDGADERAYDHYTGWALHVYPLLWTEWFDVTGTLCPAELRTRWAEDLSRYLADALALTGADGSPLMQGRSLIYRFAAAAPLWTGAVTGVGGLPPGQVRRAASGILAHFVDRGARAGDGLLTLGWHGPWPAMRQDYSGPASPYWAAKGMLGLALPADHPVWTSREVGLPVETGDVSRVITAPGWLVSARRRDGVAVVLNHGTDHARPGARLTDSPLYARLGYSTATVPPLIGSGVTDPLDNAVVLLDAEGRATHRSGFTTLFTRPLSDGVLAGASTGRVHWIDAGSDRSADHGSGRSGTVVEGPTVTVASVIRDGVEVRIARIEPAADANRGPTRARTLRLGGWPLSAAERPRLGPGACASTGGLRSSLRAVSVAVGGSAAGVDGGAGVGTAAAAAAVPAAGSSAAGVPAARVDTRLRPAAEDVTVEQGVSPLGTWTATPWLAFDLSPATGGRDGSGDPAASEGAATPVHDRAVPDQPVLVAAVVRLDDGTEDLGVDPTLTVAGTRLVVHWPDGLETGLDLRTPPGG
ncbi:hypothetical protein FHR81_004960 [Actinoalloteichus hoggarensis]|uniref:Uncharacterized protein n=1 Tax=Actinoalloteichus hoggarensis TaxID=1470176 RepID=A0A221W7U4_9PSEU|nr:DUF2264 domain-containing protein [Actinoalloteichus hoggarensis]ASO22032.1 hypothetical protein AHOG_22085 [Actinoalloteichus hoggarensis]MBB5923887.1 hypothetical protein [Actinoalloteichus hoggarensis]